MWFNVKDLIIGFGIKLRGQILRSCGSLESRKKRFGKGGRETKEISEKERKKKPTSKIGKIESSECYFSFYRINMQIENTILEIKRFPHDCMYISD